MSRSFWLLALVVAGLLGGSSKPCHAEQSILNRRVGTFYAEDEFAFEALVRFGRENHVPLGFITTQELCLTKVTKLQVKNVSVQTVLNEFLERFHSYRWRLEDGVVVFAPNNLPEATIEFLALRAQPYTVSADTLQAQTAYAWMDIKASLRPDEGTALDVLSSPHQERLPALTIGGLTVQEILNRLVRRGAAGVWVLVPQEDLDGFANHRPFTVTDYSTNTAAQAIVVCGTSGPQR